MKKPPQLSHVHAARRKTLVTVVGLQELRAQDGSGDDGTKSRRKDIQEWNTTVDKYQLSVEEEPKSCFDSKRKSRRSNSAYHVRKMTGHKTPRTEERRTELVTWLKSDWQKQKKTLVLSKSAENSELQTLIAKESTTDIHDISEVQLANRNYFWVWGMTM